MTALYLLTRLRAWLVAFRAERTPEGIEAEICGLALVIIWDSDSGELYMVDLLNPNKGDIIIRSHSRLEFIMACLALAQAQRAGITADEIELDSAGNAKTLK